MKLYALRELLKPSLVALKHYALPFVLLQLCGFAMVAAYYHVESFRSFCAQIAVVKVGQGVWFPFWTMACAGGLFPEIFKWLTGIDRRWCHQRLRDTMFNMIALGGVGILNDGFYRLLAIVIGTGTDPKTIFFKVLIDLGIYSPFVCMPVVTTLYSLRDHRYKILPTLKTWSLDFYIQRVVPLQIPAWCYWGPMVVCVYSLPMDLQFPFSVCAMSAWALIGVYLLQSPEKRKL